MRGVDVNRVNLISVIFPCLFFLRANRIDTFVIHPLKPLRE